MIKAILMDFNGVIINDEPLQMKAYQEILKAEAIDLTEEDYYGSMGMDDVTFIEAAYKRAGKDLIGQSNRRKFAMRKRRNGARLLTRKFRYLTAWKISSKKWRRAFALGIVSMARREEIEFILDKTNLLRKFFDYHQRRRRHALQTEPRMLSQRF